MTIAKAAVGCAGVIMLGFVGLVVLLAVVDVPDPKGVAEQTAAPPQGEPDLDPIQTTAVDLWKEYDANEVAANAKYEGRDVVVTGRVHSIEDTSAGPYLLLDGPNEWQHIHCTFDDSHSPTLATLQKGMKVVVYGIGAGCSVFGDPLLKRSRVSLATVTQ